MTPEERAKRLADKLGFRDTTWPDDDAHEWAVSYVAAEIRAALEDYESSRGSECLEHCEHAVIEEREACAKVAEDKYSSSPGQEAGTEIAAAIRARDEK